MVTSENKTRRFGIVEDGLAAGDLALGRERSKRLHRILGMSWVALPIGCVADPSVVDPVSNHQCSAPIRSEGRFQMFRRVRGWVMAVVAAAVTGLLVMLPAAQAGIAVRGID
jgi:hypothetical protein